MHKSTELVAEVLRPGNLVFGCDFKDLAAIYKDGIRPPVAIGRHGSRTPFNICLALISNATLPDRYAKAFHYAPGGAIGTCDLGIIISREALMRTLPGQALAIGEFFWDKEYQEIRANYDINKLRRSVYGFPIIEHLPDEHPFPDEVRIYPDNPMTIALKLATWDGFIVRQIGLRTLLEINAEAGLESRIPTLSERCEILVDNIPPRRWE